MNHLRLGIVGYRNFHDFELLEKEVLKFIDGNVDLLTAIVSGGCKGADKLAERFADKYNIPKIIHKVDWYVSGKYNPKEGPERNTLIVRDSDMIIAFVSPSSTGTFDTIRKVERSGIPLRVVKI